jgi:hypothetical protein
MRATIEMSLRLQPVDSSIGFKNTPSEKSAPMPTATMVAAAARTVQP